MNIINGKVSDGGDDITGDVGVVISGNDGPVNLGKGGTTVNSTVISGHGVVIVQGDNPDGIGKTFSGKKRR